MEPLTQQIRGKLYQRKDKTALSLDKAGANLFLRFAFIVQGTEKLIFPVLALDDWGRERNTLALYRWVYEEGQRFPRAEVFGFTRSGRETQLFLRDLEIFFKYACYVYPDRKAPVGEGLRVEAIFTQAEEGTVDVAEVDVPAHVNWPLRHAAVNWQRATDTALAATGWQESQPF